MTDSRYWTEDSGMKNLIFVLIMALATLPCGGRTITVDNDGPADFNSIQAAISDSNDGDTVVVCPGTYTGDDNRDIAFLGRAITVRSTDGNVPNVVGGTVIDCERRGCGFVFSYGEDANSVLDGLTITNGHSYRGGGILCHSSSPTIINCDIIGNEAEQDGGGMSNENRSSPHVQNCRFINNSAARGGGVANVLDSSPVLADCTFSGNVAGDDGGGMYNYEDRRGDTTLISCSFVGNRVLAGGGGGGIAIDRSNATAINCLFSGNRATVGGGIRTYDCVRVLTLLNCAFSENRSQHGRALSCGPNRCIVPAEVYITNCVLWDGGQEIRNDGWDQITVSHSDVQDGNLCCYDPYGRIVWALGNIEADPCFAFPADGHLMGGSPCIDAGTNTPVPELPTTDADGNPRSLDGDGDGNSVADMGVYEYNPAAPSIAVSTRIFHYLKGHSPSVQSLQISNCGGGILNWQIVEDCDWLEVSPANGISSGDTNEVSLTVASSGLARGHYQCTLAVSDSGAANNPVIVHVCLYIPGPRHVPTEYETIQAAIDAARDYDTVVIEPNTYSGDGNRDLDFKGKVITVRSIDPNDPNIVGATIIDCNGNEEDPHRGFYFQSDEDANSVIEGLTIINGYAPPSPYPDWPPVPLPWPPDPCKPPEPCEPPDPECPPWWPPWMCDIPEPYASGEADSDSDYAEVGGGIYCLRTDKFEPGPGPTIRNCVIRDCRMGGGMFGCGGPIVDCTISNNVGNGLAACTDPVTGCRVSGNSGAGVAGCMGPISNCIITANEDRGITVHFGTISNCLISGNKGGGISTYGGTISNCTITSNWSSSWGGGVFVAFCHGCPAPYDLPPIYDCSIWVPGKTVRITNCIIWANDAELSGKQLAVGPCAAVAVSFCLVEGGPGWSRVWLDAILYWGDGNTGPDPWFAEPGYWADAGDPNIEVEPNDPNAVWIQGDYHLLRFSPCIDAGDNNSIAPDVADLDGDGNTAEPTPLDLDLSPRVIDARNDCNAAVDMGAYETVPEPQVFYVDDDANGANDGTSWEDAFNYLQDGLDAAVMIGDQIWVAEGLYTPDCNSGDPGGTGERTASFELKKGVAVKGGFAGAGAPDPNARDFSTYETVLSGDLNGDDGPGFANNGENCYSVVSANIWVENGALTVRNCKLRSNYGMMGGAVASFLSSPNFVSCLFCGNKGVGGAAMHSESGSPSLMNCTVTGNLANTTGGILSRDTGRPTLANCILWQNQDLGGSTEASQIDGRPPVVDYSCIQGWTGSLGGVGNMGEDPCFAAAGSWDSNGVWHEGDYHLPPESPCIDGGDPCYASGADETDLDGKLRVVGGCVDMGAYELPLLPLDAHLWLLPGVIRRCGRLPKVMAWVLLPSGITKDQVDGEQLLVLNPGQVQAVVQYVIELRLLWARRTCIFAFFDKDELMGVIADNGKVELQVCGTLTSGQQFCGTDTVWISARACRYLAAFASYWLRADCGVPDWCGGFDLDQDGTVNFADFAPSE
ncbi:MAG: choice-of-anchor Q domain-containing protein [Planctomycetota bacterium]